MIHERGSERNDYHGILLYDLHGAGYTGMFMNPTWRPGYARSFTVVDFYQVAELHDQKLMSINADKFIEQYNGFVDEQLTFGCVYSVHGSVADHRKLFSEFADSCSQMPSGDDDTFDYWPAAMDMLEVYARDLAMLGWANGVGDLRGIAETHQEVMEWEDEAARLMDLTADDLREGTGLSHYRN